MIPKRQKQRRWITQWLHVTASGSSWTVGREGEPRQNPVDFLSCGDGTETMTGSFLGQSTKEKRDAKRKELQRSAEDPSPIVSRLHISASMWDNYPGQGKIEGTESGIHRGLGIVAARLENNKIKNTQNKNRNTWGMGLESWWEMISPTASKVRDLLKKHQMQDPEGRICFQLTLLHPG